MNFATQHALYDVDPDMSSNFDAEPDPKSIRHPLLHCCLNSFLQKKSIQGIHSMQHLVTLFRAIPFACVLMLVYGTFFG
jgi:hypothetical protein